MIWLIEHYFELYESQDIATTKRPLVLRKLVGHTGSVVSLIAYKNYIFSFDSHGIIRIWLTDSTEQETEPPKVEHAPFRRCRTNSQGGGEKDRRIYSTLGRERESLKNSQEPENEPEKDQEKDQEKDKEQEQEQEKDKEQDKEEKTNVIKLIDTKEKDRLSLPHLSESQEKRVAIAIELLQDQDFEFDEPQKREIKREPSDQTSETSEKSSSSDVSSRPTNRQVAISRPLSTKQGGSKPNIFGKLASLDKLDADASTSISSHAPRTIMLEEVGNLAPRVRTEQWANKISDGNKLSDTPPDTSLPDTSSTQDSGSIEAPLSPRGSNQLRDELYARVKRSKKPTGMVASISDESIFVHQIKKAPKQDDQDSENDSLTKPGSQEKIIKNLVADQSKPETLLETEEELNSFLKLRRVTKSRGTDSPNLNQLVAEMGKEEVKKQEVKPIEKANSTPFQGMKRSKSDRNPRFTKSIDLSDVNKIDQRSSKVSFAQDEVADLKVVFEWKPQSPRDSAVEWKSQSPRDMSSSDSPFDLKVSRRKSIGLEPNARARPKSEKLLKPSISDSNIPSAIVKRPERKLSKSNSNDCTTSNSDFAASHFMTTPVQRSLPTISTPSYLMTQPRELATSPRDNLLSPRSIRAKFSSHRGEQHVIHEAKIENPFHFRFYTSHASNARLNFRPIITNHRLWMIVNATIKVIIIIFLLYLLL